MKLAVVLMTMNRIDYLDLVIKSFREKAGMEFDLFVVDNGSSDRTRDYLAEDGKIRYYSNQKNMGISIGCNVGMDMAILSGDYDRIIYSGNDLILSTPDGIKSMYEASIKLPDYILVANQTGVAKILYKEAVTKEGVNLWTVDYFGGPAIFPKDFWIKFKHQENSPLALGQDTECSIWAELNGIKITYLPDVVFDHYLGYGGQYEDKPEYLEQKNKNLISWFDDLNSEEKTDVFWQTQVDKYPEYFEHYRKTWTSKAIKLDEILGSGDVLLAGGGLGSMVRLISKIGATKQRKYWTCDRSNVAVVNNLLLNKIPDNGHLIPFYSDIQKKIQCNDGLFDSVVLNEVVEHLTNPFAALCECKRVLKPGGEIIITTPGVITEENGRHIKFWEVNELARILGYGFDVNYKELYGRVILVRGVKRG